MSANAYGESAKILQFPSGGRRGAAGYRPNAKVMEDLLVAQSNRVVCGDCWYHDAAVQEAGRDDKR